jgi:hypothetical protein
MAGGLRAEVSGVKRLPAVLPAALPAVVPFASPAAVPSGEPEREDLARLARLAQGETLVFPKNLDQGAHHYVGGVTYTVLEGTPEELTALFEDAEAFRDVLPRTKEAKFVPRVNASTTGRGTDPGPNHRWVELHQGNSLMEAVYTLYLRRNDASDTVQFWLDPLRPHAIDDAWGFFRFEPMASGNRARPPLIPEGRPAVLLTYGVLVDIGTGVLRELFEEKVRGALLSVPNRLRHHLQTRGQGSPHRPGTNARS